MVHGFGVPHDAMTQKTLLLILRIGCVVVDNPK
jgi:hypothetical protein